MKRGRNGIRGIVGRSVVAGVMWWLLLLLLLHIGQWSPDYSVAGKHGTLLLCVPVVPRADHLTLLLPNLASATWDCCDS